MVEERSELEAKLAKASDIIPGPGLRDGVQLVLATGEIKYQVTTKKDPEWKILPTGATVGAGFRVKTGPKSRAEFRTPDSTVIRLNTDTEIEFESNRKILLYGGQVWSDVAKAKEGYVIAVPEMEADITALDGEFDVGMKPPWTTVSVVQGSTEVRVKDKKESLAQGEQVRIEQGRIADKGPAHDLLLAVGWVNELAALKGRDNAELNKRVQAILAEIGRTKIDTMYERDILALGDHAIMPLAAYVQSKESRDEPRSRLTAARLLSRVAAVWAIPKLIEILNDDEPEVRFYMAKALERLTDGVKHGATPEQWKTLSEAKRKETHTKWREWWKAHEKEYPELALENHSGVALIHASGTFIEGGTHATNQRSSIGADAAHQSFGLGERPDRHLRGGGQSRIRAGRKEPGANQGMGHFRPGDQGP